jgi:hypothetical protein
MNELVISKGAQYFLLPAQTWKPWTQSKCVWSLSICHLINWLIVNYKAVHYLRYLLVDYSWCYKIWLTRFDCCLISKFFYQHSYCFVHTHCTCLWLRKKFVILSYNHLHSFTIKHQSLIAIVENSKYQSYWS